MRTFGFQSIGSAFPGLALKAAVLLITLAFASVVPETSRASVVLLHDDFNGSSLDGGLWSLPTGPGSFLGRTQLRPPGMEPTVSGGVVRLQLDTFNPTAITPGDSFFGTEILTNQAFARGHGLVIEARSRVVGPVPRGMVASLFSFVTNGVIRDEIDFELLTNDINDGNPRVLTNVFDDDDFSQPGDKAFATVAGLDLTEFNTFRIALLPDRVQWFVNGQLVREEVDTVPDQDMTVRLNLWAPDAFFAEAFDATLQPAASSGENETFFYDVDFVTITAIPEPGSALLWIPGLAMLAALRRRRGMHG